MAQTQQIRNSLTKQISLAIACAVLLSACGRQTPAGVGGDDVAGATVAGPVMKSPVTEIMKEETAPTEAAEPIEGVVNLPSIPRASTTPVDPANMSVKSIAETVNIMPAPGLGNVSVQVIRAKVTWTPIKGAASYRIFQLEAKEGVAEGSKGTKVWAAPKWAPVAICGGGYGLVNLKVGQEYVYTVEALDRSGNVIARGQDNCAPLAPLSIPYLQGPGQNEAHVGQTPYFKWTESRGADGYYVQVFGTRGNLPVMPMWRGYRSNPESMNIMYGQQVDVLEGTRPLQWTLPLNVGSRYAWTVCALRTDTHAMNTAKAISRATAPVSYFLP